MFDIVTEYLELWVSPSSEYLKFEFRRVLKVNSEFRIVPEKKHGNEYLNFDFRRVPKMNLSSLFFQKKPGARQLVPNTWSSSSAEFWKWTLSSLLVRKRNPRERISELRLPPSSENELWVPYCSRKNHEKITSSSTNAYGLGEASNFKRKRSLWLLHYTLRSTTTLLHVYVTPLRKREKYSLQELLAVWSYCIETPKLSSIHPTHCFCTVPTRRHAVALFQSAL
jgi:hypothetical protein